MCSLSASPEPTPNPKRPSSRTLLVVPRVEVVGDPQRVEARRLGAARLLDEILGAVFLAGQRVSDLHALSAAP
jgi:hypothetical protein